MMAIGISGARRKVSAARLPLSRRAGLSANVELVVAKVIALLSSHT
jgi:hypothetical protein